MDKFFISGIQQIGVGTVDFRKSWNWFINMFGFDVKILEDDTVAERMLPYTGNMPHKRHACIAVNLNGGGGLEIWQYSERKPVPADFKVSLGDLGIFMAKIKCRDIKTFYNKITVRGLDCSVISTTPDGRACIYVRDLYGNTFQVVEQHDVFIRQNCLAGGIVGAMIGVSDMDRAIAFYSDVLGYSNMLYDETGAFSDWSFFQFGRQNFRRVLLSTPGKAAGAFSGLMGSNTIELVQALDREPRKIYEGRYWGDPGFIQVCYDVTGMRAFGEHCASKGYPFTVDSCPGDEVFDMGDASGHFTYIEDPDGTLIEFVETHKVPVLKKLGWYIDMNRRDREKPLPKTLFKVLGMVAREAVA